MQTIERIEEHARRIAARQDEKVQPGMPAAFTEAASAGDFGWQGDLKLIVVAAVPAGYAQVKQPKAIDRQLVPGNTEGAKHCLDSLEGVTLYRPQQWSEESLDGPCLVLTQERKILHPTHGHVTIPAGLTILCRYQREWDREQQRERRSQD